MVSTEKVTCFQCYVQANSVSYLWGRLIEQFNKHAMYGAQYYTSHPDIETFEQSMRFLAREPRTRRRVILDL
jgi:hypothetical protein